MHNLRVLLLELQELEMQLPLGHSTFEIQLLRFKTCAFLKCSPKPLKLD